MKESLNIDFNTRVLISEHESDDINGEGRVLLDKSNAIHSQNMARAISRALAKEPNYFIHRIAFGNGGSFTDAGETTIINPPNDGTRGDGWESRLYNETYSEIIDEDNVLVGTDPGSSGPNSNRIGGGSVPTDDPGGTGVVSLEVGRKSNVIATMFINQSEPVTQLGEAADSGEITDEEKAFEFDELGFYTTGKQASPTPATSLVNVGNKTSEDAIPSNMIGSQLTLVYEIDGAEKQTVFVVPSIGSGPAGEVTFGDLCEGINTGSWFSPSPGANSSVLIKASITDRTSGAVYPSISGSETFGFLVFERLVAGSGNTLKLSCSTGQGSDFLFALTGNCSRVNTATNDGINAGVANDSDNTSNERERLLTHLTFSPILKKKNRVIKIVYTLTVSVSQTGDCVPNIENAPPPPPPSPTPSVTSSVTPTPTPSVSSTATPTPTPTTSPAPSLVWVDTMQSWINDGDSIITPTNFSFDGSCFNSTTGSSTLLYQDTIGPIYGFRLGLSLTGATASQTGTVNVVTNAGSFTENVTLDISGSTLVIEKDETSGIFDTVSSLDPSSIEITFSGLVYGTISICSIEVLIPESAVPSPTPTPTTTPTPTPSVTPPDLSAMSLTFNTSLNSFFPPDIGLRLDGPAQGEIDWGDGTTETFSITAGDDQNFSSSGGGTREVIITGSAGGFSLSGGSTDTLTKINSFGDLGITSFSGSFSSTKNLQSVPDTLPSTVTDISYMFERSAILDDPNINQWDVSNVTNMRNLFESTVFNQPLNNWNVGSVTNMTEMFRSNSAFNQNIDTWDVSSVLDMTGMFWDATAFNQPLNSWNTISLTDTSRMFEGATAFNQPLNNWDMSSVTDTNRMFQEATAFNSNIDSWNLMNVTQTWSMFDSASSFDQPINGWTLGSATDMSRMFFGASSFNQPLSNWDVSAATNMQSMFENATSFNQNLSGWCVTNIATKPTDFDLNAVEWTAPRPQWGECPATEILTIPATGNFLFGIGSTLYSGKIGNNAVWESEASPLTGSRILLARDDVTGNILQVAETNNTFESTISTDNGQTWGTPSTSLTDDTNMTNAWSLRLLNGTYFIVGQNSTAGTSDIAFSTDGLTWTAATLPVTPPSNNLSSIAYGNGVYIAVPGGRDFGTSGDTGLTSTDGVTWTNLSMPLTANWVVGFFNGEFHALGGVSTTELHAAKSVDGTTWTTQDLSALMTETGVPRDIMTKGPEMIAASSYYGRQMFLKNDDGINWTTTTLPPNNSNWNSLEYGNGMYVAVGNGSDSAISKDGGNTWDNITSPGFFYWYTNTQSVFTEELTPAPSPSPSSVTPTPTPTPSGA